MKRAEALELVLELARLAFSQDWASESPKHARRQELAITIVDRMADRLAAKEEERALRKELNAPAEEKRS